MQKAFIETQFPIARLSAESYKERKANNGQTLTRLGKWWGRKPLILVRACILGMLMPASNDPKKDREIFLKILTMDDDGAWQRQKGEIPVRAWRDAASTEIQAKYFLITQLAPRRAGPSRRLVHEYQSGYGPQRDPVPERPLPA